MRKQTISPPFNTVGTEQGWLDLDKAASVQLTSDNNAFPIECALLGESIEVGVPGSLVSNAFD